MNANELADKIEYARNETDFQKWAGQAPDMLRQQQAEIESFKSHPAELTDEEIYQTWVEAKNTALNTRGSDFVEVIFARAILRKAQNG